MIEDPLLIPEESEGVYLENGTIVWWWTYPIPGRVVQELHDYLRNGPPDRAREHLRKDYDALGALMGFLSGIDVV